MKDRYRTVNSAFFQNPLFKKISKEGRPVDVAVGLYVHVSPHSNWVGIYHLPTAYAAQDLGFSIHDVSEAFSRLSQINFLAYCSETHLIFVEGMAQTQIGKTLKHSDNRVLQLRKFFDESPYREHPFMLDFVARFGDDFHIRREAPPKPFVSPSEAPPKPETGQDRDRNRTKTATETETEVRLHPILEPYAEAIFQIFGTGRLEENKKQEVVDEFAGSLARGIVRSPIPYFRNLFGNAVQEPNWTSTSFATEIRQDRMRMEQGNASQISRPPH